MEYLDKLVGAGRQEDGHIAIVAESQHPTDYGCPTDISLSDEDCRRLIDDLQAALKPVRLTDSEMGDLQL